MCILLLVPPHAPPPGCRESLAESPLCVDSIKRMSNQQELTGICIFITLMLMLTLADATRRVFACNVQYFWRCIYFPKCQQFSHEFRGHTPPPFLSQSAYVWTRLVRPDNLANVCGAYAYLYRPWHVPKTRSVAAAEAATAANAATSRNIATWRRAADAAAWGKLSDRKQVRLLQLKGTQRKNTLQYAKYRLLLGLHTGNNLKRS